MDLNGNVLRCFLANARSRESFKVKICFRKKEFLGRNSGIGSVSQSTEEVYKKLFDIRKELDLLDTKWQTKQ